MEKTAVITERFASWAAASAARNRLALNGGFARYGIDHANIDPVGSEFALVIHMEEAHRREIEDLLRSSGTMFNRPLRERPAHEPGLASPFLIFGIAAVTGAALYSLFKRRSQPFYRSEYQRDDPISDSQQWRAGRDDESEWGSSGRSKDTSARG